MCSQLDKDLLSVWHDTIKDQDHFKPGDRCNVKVMLMPHPSTFYCNNIKIIITIIKYTYHVQFFGIKLSYCTLFLKSCAFLLATKSKWSFFEFVMNGFIDV